MVPMGRHEDRARARAYLIGRGIGQSLSPAVYDAAFRVVGMEASFGLLDVEQHELGRAEAIVREPSCLGATVTMPYKFWARGVADDADEVAAACGAANLLVNRAGRLRAGNTDALAMARMLGRRAHALAGTEALVAGAGGAAAAAIWAVASVRVGRLVIVARRQEAAEQTAALARRLRSAAHIEAHAGHPLPVPPGQYGLVVQATPLGAGAPEEDPLPRLPLRPGMLVYDLVYRRDGPTALQRRALASGAELVDGAGHLVEQAIDAFEALADTKAPVQAMREALEATLGFRAHVVA
jgi:shikimate dehydrogenase